MSVDIGEDSPVEIATSWDVHSGARVVVAVAGSLVGDVEISQPRLCDSAMLGWADGISGLEPHLAD